MVALIVLALVVGGGGVGAAFGNMAVQLAALAVLAVHASAVAGFFRTAPRMLVSLVLISMLLPLAQLIPMPAGWWSGLPGRGLVAQSLALAGEPGWYPFSVAPARTLVAFLGTLAPAAVVVVACGLPPDRLVMLQRTTIALGVLVALFGTSHLISDDWGDLYSGQQALLGVLVGTFADRNAAALFLDICLLMLVGLPAGPRGTLERVGGWLAGGFLAICVVLTGSRTGMVLLAAPAFLLTWRVAAGFAERRGGLRLPGGVPGLVGLGLALAIGGAVLGSNGRVQVSLDRFDSGDGMRAEMREDARFVAERYWPAGAGMGTFDDVFQIDESLEYVSPRKAGRAHMDYLELAIEAGLAGLLIAAGWLAWAAWGGWRALRRSGAWPARAGALALASVAAQSLLSFPLRSQAMLCVAALAVVLLVRSPVAAAPREPRP